MLQRRRAIADIIAAGESAGGQELELALMIADASAKGRADPAFPGHTEVVQHWAMAVWHR